MKKTLAIAMLAVVALGFFAGCNEPVQSVSGTKMVTIGKVKVGPDGLTVEQSNAARRIDMDNKPGSVKHVYVISAYSGQVIIYSTAKGKVSSSGKRLTPDRVDGESRFALDIGGTRFRTDQILGEDGTYGSSGEYLYWWDTKDVYHQHYVSGGQIVHVSNQPIAVKGIIINMEITQKPEE